MKKKLVIAIVCSCMFGITACGTQAEIVTESIVVDEKISTETSKEENITEESVSMELIDESRVIEEQFFDIELNSWGNVQFVSYLPQGKEVIEDVSFVLAKDGEVIYTFPYYCENNNTEKYGVLFDSVAAVVFRDLNNDSMQDIVVIKNYVMGSRSARYDTSSYCKSILSEWGRLLYRNRFVGRYYR